MGHVTGFFTTEGAKAQSIKQMQTGARAAILAYSGVT